MTMLHNKSFMDVNVCGKYLVNTNVFIFFRSNMLTFVLISLLCIVITESVNISYIDRDGGGHGLGHQGGHGHGHQEGHGHPQYSNYHSKSSESGSVENAIKKMEQQFLYLLTHTIGKYIRIHQQLLLINLF